MHQRTSARPELDQTHFPLVSAVQVLRQQPDTDELSHALCVVIQGAVHLPRFGTHLAKHLADLRAGREVTPLSEYRSVGFHVVPFSWM